MRITDFISDDILVEGDLEIINEIDSNNLRFYDPRKLCFTAHELISKAKSPVNSEKCDPAEIVRKLQSKCKKIISAKYQEAKITDPSLSISNNKIKKCITTLNNTKSRSGSKNYYSRDHGHSYRKECKSKKNDYEKNYEKSGQIIPQSLKRTLAGDSSLNILRPKSQNKNKKKQKLSK